MGTQSEAKVRSEVKGKPVSQANLPTEPPSESRSLQDHANPVHEQPDWQGERSSVRMWRIIFLAAVVFWIGVGIILLERSFDF
jgi:hypothetical protein